MIVPILTSFNIIFEGSYRRGNLLHALGGSSIQRMFLDIESTYNSPY